MNGVTGGPDDFTRDTLELVERICASLGESLREPLLKISEKLIGLHERGLVKINHSVMEVVCAAHLIRLGYVVDVERYLGDNLVCDVYGERAGGGHIVEIETGFAPPENALDPQRYLMARVVSKVARYSKFSDKFSLATPRYNILEIPEPLIKPPRSRTSQEIRLLKSMCDIYYKRPPIQEEEIRNSRIHSVIILSIDDLSMVEVPPEIYYEKILKQVFAWNSPSSPCFWSRVTV
jgi:hypothetical protein